MPEEKKGLGIALVTAAVGFSLGTGPLLGGYLTTWFGWRGVFLFNVPVMALSVVVSYFFVKNKKSKYKINLNIVGAILITLFLISAMLIITQRSWIYVLLSVALVFVFIVPLDG